MKTVRWNILLLSFALFASAQESQRCPPPSAYPHTSLDKRFAQKLWFSPGEKAYFNCAEDFTPFKGNRAVKCLENGQWTKLSLKCEKISCGNAGELPNGQFVYKGEPYVGERVTAECNTGYTLKGLNSLICKKSGWTGERPTCEKTACSAPVVANSMTRGSDASVYRVGDSVTFSCRQGFSLQGAQQVTCGPEGQWQPAAPRCLPSPQQDKQPPSDKNTVSILKPTGGCDAPPPVLNSNAVLADKYIMMTSFASAARVQYVCDVGYMAAGGSRYSTCTKGRWSPLRLKCERELCGSAGEILNGHFTYTGVEFGDKATAVCDEGFKPVGPTTRNCMSGGWDGRVPECEAAVCPEPPQVANAEILGLDEESYTYRTVVHYRCLVGTLIGGNNLMCKADGTWSAPPPTCQEITCPYPNVANGIWRAPANGRYQYRETVEFTCHPGFVIKGSQYITCGADGKWLPKPPECQLKYSSRRLRKSYNG